MEWYRAIYGAPRSTFLRCDLLNWISTRLAAGTMPTTSRLFVDSEDFHLIVASSYQGQNIELRSYKSKTHTHVPDPDSEASPEQARAYHTCKYGIYGIITSAARLMDEVVQQVVEPSVQGEDPSWEDIMVALQGLLARYDKKGESI